jgi:hypothetical protein
MTVRSTRCAASAISYSSGWASHGPDGTSSIGEAIFVPRAEIELVANRSRTEARSGLLRREHRTR